MADAREAHRQRVREELHADEEAVPVGTGSARGHADTRTLDTLNCTRLAAVSRQPSSTSQRACDAAALPNVACARLGARGDALKSAKNLALAAVAVVLYGAGRAEAGKAFACAC